MTQALYAHMNNKTIKKKSACLASGKPPVPPKKKVKSITTSYWRR
jgi:hypothetical protein